MQAFHVRHCHTSNRSDHLCRSFRSLHSSQRKCSSAAARRSRPAGTQTARCQGRQASTATVQQTKQRLASLAGKKYGHNLSTQQKQDVEKVIKELEDMAPDRNKQPDLTGSNWKLLYTTSGGSSGGRVGPLVGLVDQVFPEDQPGIYINKLKLGPVKADLTAEYKYVGSERIAVNFVDIAAYLGSSRLLHKDFGGRGGYWKLTYHDDNLRILYSGQGNIFVLQRAA